MQKIKTIFIGTSEFAVPVLEKLMNLEYLQLNYIITQPDRPAGRKQELKSPAVKEFALNSGFDATRVLQPEKIKTVTSQITEEFKPELIIVASYGQIIPKEILDFPKHKALNIHVSLLPDLRGAVPMPMAILKGYKKTGVTLQVMTYGLDEGDVVASREFEVAENETTLSLQTKSSIVSASMLEDELPKWIAGEIKVISQDHSKATYCFMEDISKPRAEIKFDTDIEVAERMVRAFFPWPVAWVKLETGKSLKIFKSKIKNQISKIKNEELRLRREGGELVLDLKDGSLILEEVQLEGKNRGQGKDYLFLAG